MDKCPFCGDKLFWSQGQTTEYECNTLISETGLGPTFGKKCLEAQITTLQAQLADREIELKKVKEQFMETHRSWELNTRDLIAMKNELADREERLALWRKWIKKMTIQDEPILMPEWQALKNKGEI